jgi:hypothetical protein
VSISSPIWDGSTPASAIAFAPAMAAASVNETSCGHHRRSRIPASCSSIPLRIWSRSYVWASWASMLSDVTTIGASTARTDSTAVFV